MRVTTKMIYNQAVGNINSQYEQLFSLNEKVTSGKRINRPSDDPVDVSKVLDYRTLLGSIEQYKKNVDRGTSWLRNTESSLSNVEDVLNSAKLLAEQMATGTYTPEQRTMMSGQAEQLFDQLVQIGNTRVADQYIFAGFKTDTKPFTADESYNIEYHGDGNQIRIGTQQNIQVTINTTGQRAFVGDTNVFDVVRDLRTALRETDNENAKGTVGSILPKIDDALKQISEARASVGTSLNAMETAAATLEDFRLNTTELLSNTEDTDMVDAITQLQARQIVYEASLKSTSLITQLSLVNFM